MNSYEELLQYVIDNGEERGDRTGTGTISVFAPPPVTYRNIGEQFPLITTKKVHFKSVIYELLWFLRGDTNIKFLNDNGVRIWDEWADRDGELGPIYGEQWRDWAATREVPLCESNVSGFEFLCIDQIANVIKGIKENPLGRRHIVSAWNVGEIEQMALPPCHLMFQFYVRGGTFLDCQLYQRSADMFLGVPFNIASYALLTQMVAHVCGLKAGNFTHVLGDAHVYSNHLRQVTTLLGRDPKPFPKVVLSPGIETIDEFTRGDVILMNYDPHPAIKAKVAV